MTYLANLSETVELFKKAYPVEHWALAGFFKEDYIYRINPHWLSFPPQPRINHYSLAVMYMFIMVIGLNGNLMVIIMFLRCKSLRTPGNILILNLAISDGLMMCEIPMFIFNSFNTGPALGDIACQIYGFIGGLTGTVSIVTLMSISLDRYYVITYPLNRRFNNIRTKIFVIISWVYGVIFAAPPLIDPQVGKYVPEGFLTSCSFDYLEPHPKAKYFILIFFVAAWVIPVIVIAFSYYFIIYTVIIDKKKKKMGTFQQESFRHIKQEEKKRQEIRLAFITFAIITIWFVAWTPYAVVSLLGIFGKKDLITPTSSMIPALFAKSASCVDPFMYALSHTRFKAEVKTLICGSKTDTIKSTYSFTSSNFKRPKSKTVSSIKTRSSQSISNCTSVEEMDVVIGRPVLEMDSPISPQFTETSDFTVKKSGLGSTCTRWIFKPNFRNKRSTVRKLIKTISSKDLRTKN